MAERIVTLDPWVIPHLCRRLDWRAVFGNDQPVEVDLGAGDGGFVVALARQNPRVNYLAVERLLGRARKIAKRAVRFNLPNLKVLRLEAAFTVQYLFPPASLSGLYLLFPDPWPKRKHQPRRIIQPPFVSHVAQALVPGGVLHFKTDHADYFEKAVPVIASDPNLQRIETDFWSQAPPTDFEKVFRAEGCVIQHASFARKTD